MAAIAGNATKAHGTMDLEALARLCYFSNGVTKVLRGMPFRAAACTGALFHIEQYLVSADLPGLPAGVYHFGAHDNGLRQLRSGDFRQRVLKATGDEAHIQKAPVVMALTSTWWRNAWKYQARAYRHAFWDSGTILANLLAVAAANAIEASVVLGFEDASLNNLLDVDPTHEGTVALVALGTDAPPPQRAPDVSPLALPTQRLSAHEVAYPEIAAAHAASSLPSSESAAAWRSQFGPPQQKPATSVQTGESIEAVILRRGSTRRFTHAAIPRDALQTMLEVATTPVPSDAFIPTDLYLIVNAVDGLASGTYVWNRATRDLQPLRLGEFRREATYLDLGQELAGDAALNAYWLVNLGQLDDRSYRAAQLSAAIEGGKLYLAAYALHLGATGLTFFDDDVTDFFSPHAAGKSVMFLTAVGVPFRTRS
ncbi:MAG: SagB family peptide dehydrogenase [Chloroflexi bacterium]|nr:SagB family peptide dehydrogenase [Chloroflexota bacterium]